MRIRNSMFVKCNSCGNCHTNDSNLKTLNIEEDIQGRDLLTFVCPDTSETTKAYVMIGHEYEANDNYWQDTMGYN